MYFDALIVDPNPVSRGYLWQATLCEPNFRRVKAVSGLTEALNQLQKGNRYDVLLITSEVQSENIKEFVPQAKQIEGGREAAYVVVLKKKDQDSEKIALGIVDGTDGFLLEPFSVQSLKQVAAIAARVRGEHERQRAKAALSLMLFEIGPKLDAYAESRRTKSDAITPQKEFIRSAQALKRLVAGNEQVYAEVAAEIFEQAPPRVPKGKYKGASKRVREMESK
ncbi:MAG: hypothetical protein U0136_01155 [Bdellovibrionota bacterium]